MRFRLWATAAIAVFCACSTTAAATNGLTYLDGSIFSAPLDMSVSDTVLAVGYSSGMEFFSIADPAHPRLLSRLYEQGLPVREFEIQDSLLVVGTRDDSIRVYSISDIGSPRLISKFSCECKVGGVLLNDGTLYISSQLRLHIYSLANPAAPEHLATVETDLYLPISGMCVRDDTLFLAAYDLYAWDVSDLHHPQLLEQLDVPYAAFDVVSVDGILAVAAQEDFFPTYSSALVLYRAAPDSGLVPIASDTVVGRCNYLDHIGSRVYLSCGESGFQVLDISIPETPVLIECIETDGVAGPVLARDSLVFFVSFYSDTWEPSTNACLDSDSTYLLPTSRVPSGSVTVFKQTDSTLSRVGRIPSGGELARLSCNRNGLVAVADNADRVHLLSIGDSWLGEERDIALPGTGVQDVYLRDSSLVVATRDSGLLTYSIRDTIATRQSQTMMSGDPYRVSGHEGLVVACDWLGTTLYDFTSQDILVEVCRVNYALDFAIDATYDGRYLYVSERYAGVRIWDLGDFSNPVSVAQLSGRSTNVSVDGTLLATGRDYLTVWDVSEPAAPVLYSDIPLESPAQGSGQVWGIDLDGTRLAAARAEGDFQVYDISDSANIKQIGFAGAPRWATDATLVNDNLLGLDLYSLMLYRIDAPTSIDDDWSGAFDLDDALNVDAYPNPFNSTIQVRLSLRQRSEVRIDVVNVLGQSVANVHSGVLSAGDHQFEWNAAAGTRAVSSGVYLLRVTTGDEQATKKILYLK